MPVQVERPQVPRQSTARQGLQIIETSCWLRG